MKHFKLKMLYSRPVVSIRKKPLLSGSGFLPCLYQKDRMPGRVCGLCLIKNYG